jgi:hypothetical protein
MMETLKRLIMSALPPVAWLVLSSSARNASRSYTMTRHRMLLASTLCGAWGFRLTEKWRSMEGDGIAMIGAMEGAMEGAGDGLRLWMRRKSADHRMVKVTIWS